MVCKLASFIRTSMDSIISSNSLSFNFLFAFIFGLSLTRMLDNSFRGVYSRQFFLKRWDSCSRIRFFLKEMNSFLIEILELLIECKIALCLLMVSKCEIGIVFEKLIIHIFP